MEWMRWLVSEFMRRSLGVQTDMSGFTTMGVYEYYPQAKWKEVPDVVKVGVRRVDVFKSGHDRSLFVAMEFAITSQEDSFAATPPPSAVNMLLSECASRTKGAMKRLMVIDIKKAFLHGMIKWNVFSELSAEDPRAGDQNIIGKVLRTMHGAGDAVMPQRHSRNL